VRLDTCLARWARVVLAISLSSTIRAFMGIKYYDLHKYNYSFLF
jgi:hypothetical protein